MLEMRSTEAKSEWVFPAQKMSGHIESSTLKKQQAAAVKTACVSALLIYDLPQNSLNRSPENQP